MDVSTTFDMKHGSRYDRPTAVTVSHDSRVGGDHSSISRLNPVRRLGRGVYNAVAAVVTSCSFWYLTMFVGYFCFVMASVSLADSGTVDRYGHDLSAGLSATGEAADPKPFKPTR